MSASYRRERDSRLKVLFMAITRNPRIMVSQLILSGKLMSRRVRRLPGPARFSLFFSLIMCFILYGSILYWLFGNQLTSNSFLEVDKCPACFGFKMCESARAGNVWFTGWSKMRLLDFVNVDNEYTGVAGGTSVTLRKLGKNREIAVWEQRICSLAQQPPGCEISNAAVKALMASGTGWMPSYVTGLSNLTTCPTERLLEKIMDRYHEKADAIDLSARERIQLIVTIMLNQEPIVFQTFPHAEGWPFPTYFGACGRFVVIESGYRPLHEFYDAVWIVRANLTLKLLQIAKKFTDNKSQYGIYWTDINYSTFAVNEASMDVVVADGRNIMVVDLYQIKEDKKRHWDQPLYSNFDHCNDGDSCKLSAAETNLLCDRHVADRNYYAVCRYILSPYAKHGGRSIGLLHDTPSDIDSMYGISDLVESCTKPTQPRQRFDAATQLMKSLTELVGSQQAVALHAKL